MGIAAKAQPAKGIAWSCQRTPPKFLATDSAFRGISSGGACHVPCAHSHTSLDTCQAPACHDVIDNVLRKCGLRTMPAKIRSDKPRARHFLREWRKARNLSQQALADKIGATKQSLSRIELHEQPYNQDTLELLADALGTTPAGLLTGPPGTHESAQDPPNSAFLALLLASVFEKLAGLGETEAAVLAQGVVELASAPAHELEGIADRAALTRALASFALRQVSLPKKQ